jgi:hypothetical protein
MRKHRTNPSGEDAQEGLRLGLVIHDLLTREESALDGHDLDLAEDLATRRRDLERAWSDIAGSAAGGAGEVARALDARLRAMASCLEERRVRLVEAHLKALMTVLGEMDLEATKESEPSIPLQSTRRAERLLLAFA